MRDHRRTAMDPSNRAVCHCERNLYESAFFQPKVFSINECAVGTQVARAADFAGSAWNLNVHGGLCVVA
jgi:hypothetical protein